MPHMIDADELFKTLMERSRGYSDRLRTTYQIAGEAAVQGREIDDYTKGTVREHKALVKEIDEIVKIMQRMQRMAAEK